MKKNFLIGVFVIGLGSFFAKLLGAVYRIPLLNIVGSKAFGMYQLIFPLYALFFTLSSTGLPIAISKMMSSELARNNKIKAKQIFISSFVLSLCLGVIGFLIIELFSGGLASLQGDTTLKLGYLVISPSLLLVCGISCFRGYFQANGVMKETAISQNIEQLVKLIVGLSLGFLFRNDIVKAFLSLVLAVTMSEVVAFLYLLIRYLFKREKLKVKTNLKVTKEVFLFSYPITLSVILLPLSQVIDSVIIVRLLSKNFDNAVSLFGFLTGSVNSFNSMPIALASAVSVAIVPKLAGLVATNDTEKVKKNIILSIKITLYIALALSLGTFILADDIVNVLYPKLLETEKIVIIRLLKLSVFNIVFLSLLATTNSVLQALNKIYIPLFSIFVGIVLKIVFTFILVSNVNLGILGAGISQVICYFVAFSINLYYIIRVNNFRINLVLKAYKPLLVGFIMGVGVYCLKMLLALKVPIILELVFCSLFGVMLFLAFLFIFKEININKLKR